MKQLNRRAVNQEQKAQRREDILNSARELFISTDNYDAILMKHIAENISLTKGTLYLYFKTKEEVFLALYEREFELLCDRMVAGLAHDPGRRIDKQQLHALVCKAVIGHALFLRLNGLLHSVLEHNIEYDTALAFKIKLRDRLMSTAAVLEQHVLGLGQGRGAELLLLVHEVTIGTYHAATPSPCLDLVFERPDMQFMKLDFSVEFPKMLDLVLTSYLTQ